MGALKARLTDTRSRDIFFVDAARSIGIEARKDEVTSKVQYKQDGQWKDVSFTAVKEHKNAPQGKLVLTYKPTKVLDNPKYYNHFTLSKIVDGVTQLLNFEEGQADMGEGSTWANTFKNGIDLDEGKYLLTTGTRLADGSVLATNQIFDLKANTTTTLPLEMRTSQTAVSVIGSFNSESMFEKDGAIRKQIAKEMKLQNPDQMPVFIIADTFNRVVFISQGYTIGLGEQLHKVVNGI